MLRIAVPNKGTLSSPASEMLGEAGYRQRRDQRDLTVLDPIGGIEFFYLRPKDIPIYVGSGDLDLGITGRDQALDSGAPVEEILALGFGGSTFRYAALADNEWKTADLHGRRVATSYPKLVRDDLARHGVTADVIYLDGAVEISIQLGVADAIADVVESGRSLRQHNLVAFGDPVCVSEAVLVRRNTHEISKPLAQFVARLRGVVLAQHYVMLDYDCARDRLDGALALTPGLQSPTIAPLADPGWVGVRAMIRRKDANGVMDKLVNIGAKAVLASDIRSCRL